MTDSPASDDHDLVLSRLIDAPREKLFRAWTQSDQLEQWFAPLLFTTPAAVLNVRPGGSNCIVVRGADGVDMPNRTI